MRATDSSNPRPASVPAAEEIGPRELFHILWGGRWLIIAISVVCVLGAGVAALLATKDYEAVVLVSPVTNQPGSGGLGALGSAASQLGGLASLAGLPTAGGGGPKEEAVATLQSELLTERYIQENGLLPLLFNGRWDPKEKKWRSNFLRRKPPTIWKGNQYFKKNVRGVKEAARTGLVTMTITWTDPALAAEWANGLVKLTNDYLRDKAIRESDQHIAYLTEQISKTSAIPVRDSMYSLMETEIKKEMLARGSEEYALKVVDPATAPEKPVSPEPVLWVFAAFCVGLVLSSGFVFIRFIVSGRSR
jgi:uncharacterized protein involved in exopolysaccharide biosynthesis